VTYPNMGLSTPANKWDDNLNGNPIKDVLDAVADIRKRAKVDADTIVMASDVHAKLIQRPDIQKLFHYAGSGFQLDNGVMARFLGLNVMVSNPLSKNVVTGAESFLLGDKVLVMRAGRDTGIIHVAEPLEMRRWDDLEVRGIRVELMKTFEPHIWREKQIFLLNDVLA